MSFISQNQKSQISKKQDERNIYAIIKTMSPPQLSTQWLCGNSCTRTYDTCTLCTAVHHVPKCISCHKAIVVITGRAHCFHECIYIMPIFLL